MTLIIKWILISIVVAILGFIAFVFIVAHRVFQNTLGFSYDEKGIYFNGKRLEGVDKDSFEIASPLNAELQNDRSSINHGTVVKRGLFVKMYVGSPYGKDNNNIYYKSKLISHDVENFEVIHENENKWIYYAKDSQYVYFEDTKIAHADVTSFELINDYYARDKNNVYFKDKKVSSADRDSFKVLKQDSSYAKDIKHYYFEETALLDFDVKSDILIVGGYSTDKKNVYFNALKIEEVDVKKFKIPCYGGAPRYAYDDKNVWYENAKMQGVDIDSFVLFSVENGREYAKDKNHIYLNGKQTNFLEKIFFYRKYASLNFENVAYLLADEDDF